MHTGILVNLGVTDQQINSPGELKDEAVIKMERLGRSTFCLKPDTENNEATEFLLFVQILINTHSKFNGGKALQVSHLRPGWWRRVKCGFRFISQLIPALPPPR